MIRTYRSPAIEIRLADKPTADADVSSDRVQILRVGTFTHPEYGKFEITREVLLSMVQNFDKRVRGVDLAIDYAHEADKVAAGWIKKLSIENENELWAEVSWTPAGKQKISDREYRYLSADFSFQFKSNESGEAFGPTLFGAGLTNRPVVKGMEPVIPLSEGGSMDPKDQKIAELEAKIAELMKKQEGHDAMAAELADAKKKLGEMEAGSQKAAEEQKLSEKKTQFDKMLSEGKAVEAQREAFVAGDMIKFAELAQPVKLSEQPGGGKAPEKPATAQDEVMELAEKHAKENGVHLSESISSVLKKNPELSKRYRAECGG